MDRLNQLRGEAGGSGDSTLDTSSPPSEAFMTANESSSKYFSLSEVDSTFDISPIKDISLASASVETEKTITEPDQLISNLSPIGKKSDFDTYKIGKQIEAANILSGGVDIFDDNDNSYDGDELVIDDNAEIEEKSNPDLKLADSQFKDDVSTEATLVETDAVPSKDTEVILQIDGKNVDAIDIGNGLYLYRKEGQEELAAVQIQDDDQQQTSFKFLKVRENNEGNLEVYEEIQIEVPKEVPVKEEKVIDKNVSHVPIKDISKVISDSTSNKIAERKIKTQTIPKPAAPVIKEPEKETVKDIFESKSDANLNKKMIFSESRKSPVIGSFTPMTFHSTPNKEGIPLTKTMVDQQLHPSRHSDNVKKTIEVHTDSVKQRILESPCKQTKDSTDDKDKEPSTDNEKEACDKNDVVVLSEDNKDTPKDIVSNDTKKTDDNIEVEKTIVNKEEQAIVSSSLPSNERAVAEVKADSVVSSDVTETTDVKIEAETTGIKTSEETKENKIKLDKEDCSVISESKPTEGVVKNKSAEKMDVTSTLDMKSETTAQVKTDEVKPEKSKQTPDKESEQITTGKPIETPNTKDAENINPDPVIQNEVKDTESGTTSVCDSKDKPVNTVTDATDLKPSSSQDDQIPAIIALQEKETEQQVKPDSTADCKTPQLVETPPIQVNKTLTVKNTEPIVSSQSIPESSQPQTVVDKPPEKEAVKVQEVNKSNAVLENVKPDNKEKKISDQAEKKTSKETDVRLSNEADKKLSKEAEKKLSQEAEKKLSKEAEKKLSQEAEKKLSQEAEKNTKKSDEKLSNEAQNKLSNKAEKTLPNEAEKKLPNEIEKESTNKGDNKLSNEANKNLSIEAKKFLSVEANKNLSNKAEKKLPCEVDKKLLNETDKKSPNIGEKKPSTEADKKLSHEGEKKVSKVVEEKNKPCLKKDVKNTVAETVNKPVVVESIEKVTCNIAVPEPTKSAPKLDILTVKEKEQPEILKLDVKPIIKQQAIKQTASQPRNDLADKKVVPKIPAPTDQKPINNNHAPVPFGKWTDVNRQAFLNKIKESKVPTNNSSNGKQIKNSNDLNRRDVLKKIDSQRQAQELANMNKLGVKKEAAFASKPLPPQDSKPSVKTEITILKNNSAGAKKVSKQEPAAKPQTVTTTSAQAAVKKETLKRKEINNQDLIDKTIEDIINRAGPVKTSPEESGQTVTKDSSSAPKSNYVQPQQPQSEKPITQTTLDAIEMKMNELHGIPFIERPAHELPHVPKPANKSVPKSEPQKAPASKPSKLPNLVPFATKVQKDVKENVIELDSEEEVIEHEPITGDMDLIKRDTTKLLMSDNSNLAETVTLISADSSKKETIITEKDFDKFVRRNSINYENCLTVNFDANEPHHNVVQTVVQKDSSLKTYTKSETLLGDQASGKLLSPRKNEPYSHNSLSKPAQNIAKFGNLVSEDESNKNYQSKVKMAYQTAMTAKRQLERPITIIEDRPVKVVYMDSNAEYIPTPLNFQGQDLSPTKKPMNDLVTTQITDSLDSDTLDSIDEGKVIDDTKVKTKHQRKQVLTPVETPELELIAPDDIGIEVSPKKKRRTEEKTEKNSKTLVPKKSYLLGRGSATEDSTKPFDLSKNTQKESPKSDAVVSHKNTASAIDSLVKAAELLETQSASITSKSSDVPATPDSQQNTPVKRGRGRPRKNPLPEGATDKTKVPSPQKKPRLIDAKVVKSKSTDEDDDSSDDDLMVKENWTMGKINENIVCPICNKLFRSENVVFKHVKHCTGPSPSRSDSDNKSPRRFRHSQESDTKSFESKSDDMDIDETITPHRDVRKKRKSKDTASKIASHKDDVIVIEDTPIKPKVDRREESKPPESRKINKNKVPDKPSSLVCEFCGKTFRQLSYLVNHKLQHGKDDTKKNEEDLTKSQSSKSVFSCETCKKEFRKLHHLVQHRIIHNPSSASAKLSRKSSSEQSDGKSSKDHNPAKQNDDPSAGFRCEPCDKSFRKLHHLVEHRETHDGINRQKITSTTQTNIEKLPPPPQCDVCKKTFRKLHHLIEHKEQHLETSSEKSDDKSIKSSLSTKDIIHECSLCYMVFPNEHSLNKHTIICQRKKRQSASKQIKQTEEGDKSEDNQETIKPDESKSDKNDDVTIVMSEFPKEQKPAEERQEKVHEVIVPKTEEKSAIIEKPSKSEEPISVQSKESLKSKEKIAEKLEMKKVVENVEPKSSASDSKPILPVKVKEIDDKEPKPKTQETLRKKTPHKDKVAPTVTKRLKPNIPPPVVVDIKPAESSDDDEIRYMLNPDYKFEDNEGKIFMKVRANKRNSLQIERPNSKDLVKRRISLQHPPKVPRLKPKPIQTKVIPSTTSSTKTVVKAPKLEPAPSTDSDDSDVKYSFPEPSTDNVSKPARETPETTTKEPARPQRKSMAEKRKSLSSIAKRKSLGKAVGVKHKVKPSPLKQVRKRTAEVEHRCDCGQLFSSAALLSRHTTLAHTPPRIRRRRSPPPEVITKPIIKPAPRKSTVAAKGRPSADSRKSSVRSDSPTPKAKQPPTKRKSSVIKPEPKTPTESRKSTKSSDKTESKSASSKVKLRRYAAHKGVPVPEKMRKLMEKSKK